MQTGKYFENYEITLESLRTQLSAERAKVVEECAKVADRYADNPLGDERQETLEAFSHGMTYTAGGADTASAIASAIRLIFRSKTDRVNAEEVAKT